MGATSVDSADVRFTLRNIVSSRSFYGLRRLQQFLEFVVSETLAGRGEQLKERTIGVTVYRRPVTYDPKIDSIVRVEAVKLRRRLWLFYEHEGSREATLIHVRKGSYVPEFALRYDHPDPSTACDLIEKGNYLLFKFFEKFTLDACSSFRQALQADPGNRQARNSLIHSLWFASAAELLPPIATAHELSSLIDPAESLEDSEAAVSEMIVSGFCRGDLSRAVSAGRRALDLDPHNVMAAVCAGAVLISAGASAEAENLFRRSIRLHPGIFFFRCGYTIALYFAGKLKQAREIAVEIAPWEPDFWPMQWLLAQIHATLGHYDEALAAAEGALSVRCPPMALSRLAWLYAVTGNREKSEVSLQQVHAMSTTSYVAPSGVAAVYAALGRMDEAEVYLRQAVATREPLLGHASADPRLAPLVGLM